LLFLKRRKKRGHLILYLPIQTQAYTRRFLASRRTCCFLFFMFKLILSNAPEFIMKVQKAFFLFLLISSQLAASASSDQEIDFKAIKKEIFKGNTDQVIEELSEVLTRNPKQARAFSLRASAYFSKKLYEKALEDYSKVIELQPHNAKAYLDRGVVYLILKKNDLAERDIKKAVSLNKNLEKLARTRSIFYKQLQSAIREN
jgi:tetratricopeptide (TPR) repeat protein